MSAEIDDDRIVLMLNKTADEARRCKERMNECIILHNQLTGIRKDSKNNIPVSALTKKPMSIELRKIIFDECLEAAKRLQLV